MSGGRDGTRTRRRRLGTLSRTRWWWRVRVLLLVVAAGLVPVVLTLGSVPAPLDHLRGDVAAGSVTAVEVRGEPLEAGSQGSRTQELRWRDGLLLRTTEVDVVAPGSPELDVPTGEPVLVGDAADDLGLAAAGVTVTRAERPLQTSGVGDVELPAWVGVPLLLVWVGAVASLVGSPHTWRLNGWGWGWLLVMVPPVGAVAALLLSGPLPPLPRARRRRRGGLTGFLLAVVVGAVPGLLGWAAWS